jgi:hypothetical protein
MLADIGEGDEANHARHAGILANCRQGVGLP